MPFSKFKFFMSRIPWVTWSLRQRPGRRMGRRCSRWSTWRACPSRHWSQRWRSQIPRRTWPSHLRSGWRTPGGTEARSIHLYERGYLKQAVFPTLIITSHNWILKLSFPDKIATYHGKSSLPIRWRWALPQYFAHSLAWFLVFNKLSVLLNK